MNVLLTDDKALILTRCEEIQKLFQQSYWAGKRSVETWRRAIENSLCYAMLDRQTGALIGFARVVTDGSTMYYLCDVLIDESYRGHGLGKRLVERVVGDERLAGCNGLLKTRDAQGLYKQYGFQDCSSGCMVKF